MKRILLLLLMSLSFLSLYGNESRFKSCFQRMRELFRSDTTKSAVGLSVAVRSETIDYSSRDYKSPDAQDDADSLYEISEEATEKIVVRSDEYVPEHPSLVQEMSQAERLPYREFVTNKPSPLPQCDTGQPRKKYLGNSYDIDALTQEYELLYSIYKDYALGDAHFLRKRLAVFKQLQNEALHVRPQKYVLSNAVINLLKEHDCKPEAYTSWYGNQVQQLVHQECIDVLARIATVEKTSPVHPYKKDLVSLVNSAYDYNRIGMADKSCTILDFCWSLLDYGKAIVEGVAEGVIAAAEDMIKHPLQTAMCVVAGEYVLAYHLGKVLYNVAEIGLISLIDTQEGSERWDEYIQPLTTLAGAIANKQVSIRECVKGAARLTACLATQQKLLTNLSGIYQAATKKAVAFAKNNPLVTPAQYMKSLEGKLCKIYGRGVEQIHQKQILCPVSCAEQYQRLKSALRVEEFTSVVKVTKHGIQRLVERGFTPEETIELITKPHYSRIQSDGAKVFIQNIGDRYKIIILNETTGEVVSALKNTTRKKIMHLAQNYGWEL